MRNFIYVTPRRYLLDSEIVYLKAEVSAKSRWTQISGTPVIIDDPNSPITFYRTTGFIEPKVFEICLVEFEGYCQRVEILPYDPSDPNQVGVKYELDQPPANLGPNLNLQDPVQYKFSPQQAYEFVHPFQDSGLTNNPNSKFQPKTEGLILFDEPSRFNLSVNSAGGVEWTLLSGTLNFNPTALSQIASYWGGTVNLKANNFTTFHRFTSLRLNTRPQTFISNLFMPVAYRIDGLLNRFYKRTDSDNDFVYLLEGNKYGQFEPVGFYGYKTYAEDNKPFFFPFRECLIRPIEYRLSLINLKTNAVTNLYTFSVNLVSSLRNNLIVNDAFVGFAGVNYTLNSNIVLSYLPAIEETFEVLLDDLENLNLAPSYPESNCS